MASDPEFTGSLRRSRGWRVLGLCVGAVSLVALVGILGVGALLWRLSNGPMEVETIARVAERVMSATLGGGRQAKVGHAELEWSWKTYGLIISLQTIEVGDGNGRFDVRVPRANIELQTLPLFWGAVRPAALDLSEPKIVIDLSVADSATVQPGVMAQADPTPQPPQSSPEAKEDPRPAAILALQGIVQGLGGALDAAAGEGLTLVALHGGTIDVKRPAVKGDRIRVLIPEIEIEARLSADGNADLGFSAKGEIGRWGMRLRQIKDPATQGRRIVFEANDVTARDLIGPLPPDIVLDMPVYPVVDAGLDASGRLTALRLDLRLGAGVFHFGKFPEDEILIDEGQVSAAWDPAANQMVVEHIGASTGPTSIGLKGRIAPPAHDAAPAVAKLWRFEFGLDKAVLAPRDAGGDPLPVEAIRLLGSMDLQGLILDFEDIEARLGGTVLKGLGYIDFNREKPQLVMNFAAAPTDWTVVRRAWPAFLASGARDWFVKEVFGGRVTDAVIKLDLPLLTEPQQMPATSVNFFGRFQAGAIHVFGDLPDAVGLEGQFSSKDKRFEAKIDKGTVATKYARKPELAEAKFVIPDSFLRPPHGHIEFRVIGESGAIGEIANAEPLAILDDAKMRPDGLLGSADVRGSIDLTLEPEPKPADIDFKVEAVLDRFGSPYPIQGRKLQDAMVKVVGDPKGTSIIGKAKIDGVLADVNLYEPRVKSKTNERRDFKLTLDEATRQRMGLDLSRFLTGPMQVAIGQTPGGNEKARHIDADLTAARVTLAPFGWTKGAGVPAKATLDLVEDDKGTRIENLTIESEGMQIKGRVELDKDRRPAAAEFTRFALRKGDDAKLKFTRQGDQPLLGTFEAGTFDARGLIQAMKHANDGQATAGDDKVKSFDLSFKAKLARMIGFNDIVLSDAVIEATIRSGAVVKLNLSGRAPGGRSMEVTIKPEGNRRLLTVTSDDAGAVLGFLDLYDRMRGGSLLLNAALSGPGTADGDLRIVGFRLQAQAKVDKGPTVDADGTRTVAIRHAPVTDDTSFDRFAANYSLRKGIITVTEGIAKGPATGATASGQIDLNNQKMQLKGTFIPLYGLNNLVSRIPIIGEIAGAGRNEGLLGVTFKVVGAIDDPVLQVNPISAIAPGIFRKIFEYQVDGAKGPTPAEDSN